MSQVQQDKGCCWKPLICLILTVYTLVNMKLNYRWGLRRQFYKYGEPVFVMLTALNKWPLKIKGLT